MDEQVKENLERYADEADISLDDAEEALEDKQEELTDILGEGITDDELPLIAARSLVADQISKVRVSGKTEELPILALGHGGERPLYGRGQGVVAVGIVNPTEGGIINDPPKSDPAGLAVFTCEESRGADLGRVRKLFSQPRLNTLKGWFSRRQAENVQWKGVDGEGEARPVYVCGTTEETKLEEVDPEDGEINLPADITTKRKLINNQYVTEEDSFTLETFVDNLSAMENGYPADNGADIKRYQGWVVDVARDADDKDYGRYTLIDESVADDPEQLLDTDLSVGREGSTIGLNVWIPPEFVEYGVNSLIEVYGTLTPNNDGDIWMNAVCALPITKYQLTQDQLANASSSSGEKVEEKGNVKRRSI